MLRLPSFCDWIVKLISEFVLSGTSVSLKVGSGRSVAGTGVGHEC